MWKNSWDLLRKHRDLRLLFCSNALWTFGAMLYSFVWPNYVRDLGGSAREIGLLTSLMFATIALTLLPGGWLADRFERKRLMLVTWGLATLAPIFYITAQTWTGLIPGAILYCVFLGWPAVEAYMADAVPPSSMARAFTQANAGYSLGAILSPPLGAALLPHVGMRGLFWLAFVFFIASTCVLAMLTPQRPTAQRVRLNLKEVVADRGLLLWTGLFIVAAWASSALRPFLSPYFEDVLGLERPWILATSSLLALGEVVLTPLLGHLGDRDSPRALAGGLWALAVGCLLLLFGGVWGLVPAALFLGGDRVSASLFRSTIGKQVIVRRGTVFAGTLVLASLAEALGPLAGARLYALAPQGPIWLAMGLASILGGLAWMKRGKT